jgi:uncharacterized protein YceK
MPNNTVRLSELLAPTGTLLSDRAAPKQRFPHSMRGRSGTWRQMRPLDMPGAFVMLTIMLPPPFRRSDFSRVAATGAMR